MCLSMPLFQEITTSLIDRYVSSIEEGKRTGAILKAASWAGLWTLSSMPSIYGNDVPTGKPGPRKCPRART